MQSFSVPHWQTEVYSAASPVSDDNSEDGFGSVAKGDYNPFLRRKAFKQAKARQFASAMRENRERTLVQALESRPSTSGGCVRGVFRSCAASFERPRRL
jgi:hypothetical protein